MNYLLDLLSTFSGQEYQQRLVFVALVGGAVFAMAFSIALLYSSLSSVTRRRASRLAQTADTGADSTKQKQIDFIERYVGNISKYLFPENDAERSRIEAKLIHAGFQGAGDVKSFYAIKTILAIAFGFGALLVTQWFPELSAVQIWLAAAIAAFVGMTLPNMVLTHMAERRIRRIRNAFPDALDMFVVCVEAGLGFNATVQRVAKELEMSHEELARELDLVASQMRLGIDRTSALKGLASRTGLEEISGLVTLIDQSARFGTSIAETLRTYSEDFRDRRTQRAEEAAAKVGTKMIFPMVLLIWPSFFIVAVGPAAMMMVEAFSSING